MEAFFYFLLLHSYSPRKLLVLHSCPYLFTTGDMKPFRASKYSKTSSRGSRDSKFVTAKSHVQNCWETHAVEENTIHSSKPLKRESYSMYRSLKAYPVCGASV